MPRGYYPELDLSELYQHHATQEPPAAAPHSFARFKAALDKRLQDPLPKNINSDGVNELIRAVDKDAFKARAFAHQPLYGADRIETSELLCRPQTKEENFNIELISRTVEALGLSTEFDVMVGRGALRTFMDQPEIGAVSINVSVQSVLDPEYWEYVLPYADKFGAENITFEILENEVPRDADISLLKTLKKKHGFKLALDDMSFETRDLHRMFTFSDIIDEVKIDGPLVRAYFEDGHEEKGVHYGADQLERMIEYIQSACPHAIIAAERSDNKEEVEALYKLGVDVVQGYNLHPEDFSYTSEAMSKAELEENTPS